MKKLYPHLLRLSLALGFFSCFSCAHHPTDYGQVESEKEIFFFANHPGKNFYFSNPSAALDIFSSALRDARVSIDIALYQLNHPQLVQELLQAHVRGVVVRVVGDHSERNSSAYLRLQAAGIPIVAGNKPPDIQHNKFIIIDNRLLLTGSGNFTVNDFLRSTNHFVRIRSKPIISRYLLEFEQMFAGNFGKKKIRAAANIPHSEHIHFKRSPDKKISAYFFPQDRKRALEHILRSIKNARYSIHYMIFSFSQHEIASALIEASHHIPVEGIHDSNFITGTAQQAPRLFAAAHDSEGLPRPNGPTVYQEGSYFTAPGNPLSGGKMHCKTMLIDAESEHGIIMIGSFNWSQNAMNDNDENLLIIEDAQAAEFLLRHYHQQKKAALIPNKLDSSAGSFSSYMQDVVISEIGWAGSYSAKHAPTDFFIEFYNRSEREIDLAHWTLELESMGKKSQFTFRSPQNAFKNVSSEKIPPHSYALFYFNKTGYFSTLPSGKFLNLAGLTWKNSASLRVRLYDKHMNLADQAVIYDNGSSGYYDRHNKKIASVERLGEDSSFLQDGRFFSSWYSSYTPVAGYASMLHSAGSANSQTALGAGNISPRPPLAFSLNENSWQTFWQFPLQTCDINKIMLDAIPVTGFQPFLGGLVFLSNLPSVSSPADVTPHYFDFQASACASGSLSTAPSHLRLLAHHGESLAKARIEEIHYHSTGKDYMVIEIEESGYLKEYEVVSLTAQGYTQLYRFFPLYYKQGEKLKIYLNSSLENFFTSYDQSNVAARDLNFYSLHNKFSREDEVLFLREGETIHEMVFLSNRDGNMGNELKKELEELSFHSPWAFSALSQSMNSQEVQNFGLDSTLLNNSNSYIKDITSGGWKFSLQNISP